MLEIILSQTVKSTFQDATKKQTGIAVETLGQNWRKTPIEYSRETLRPI
ncbi:hypothetical protein [Oscillatoria nigro-viridis]|nr:hypothetical protein [Oscillatoria nigro-viridis]